MSQDIPWGNVNVLMHNDANEENTMKEIEYQIAQENTYIPRKSKKALLQIFCISITLILVISILITVVALNSIRKENNSGNNEFFSQSSLSTSDDAIIISASNQMWLYNLKTTSNIFLQEFNNSILAFDLYLNKLILFSVKNTSVIKSLPENHADLVHAKKWNPQAMAIDFVDDKVYVIDKLAGTVNVIDKKGKNSNIVLSDLKKPHDITIDPIKRLLFITQQSNSIIRASVDGTQRKAIVNETGISVITIDYHRTKIYWAIDYIGIIGSDYDGKNRIKLSESSINIESITFSESQLFWLWPAYWRHNATLWSCTINEGICQKQVNHSIAITNPKMIKAYSKGHVSELDINNPCKKNNGNCMHLCFLISSGHQSCACNLGWQLNSDMKTCRLITDFILYTKGNFIRGKILNNSQDSAFNDAIYPIQFYTESLSYKNTIDFDYNMRNDEFYFSDDLHIYKINLMSDVTQTIITSKTNESYYIGDLAVDWVSEKLYYSQRSISMSSGYITIIDIKEGKNFIKKVQTFGASTYGLISHANKGYLFFTCYYNSKPDIHRMNMNNFEYFNNISIPYLNHFKKLAIDYEEDKLYYVARKTPYVIYRKNLNMDNSDTMSINMEFVIDIRSIFIYKQHIYVSNLTNIWRCDKLTGKNCVQIESSSELIISGVKIFSPLIQSISNENDCAINNGECEQFCFSRPQKLCGCMDNYRLLNGKHCQNM